MSEALDYLLSASSWEGRNGLGRLLWNHVRLSGAVVFVAVALTVPPALWLGHRRRGGAAVTTVNLSRALPTFAVIALVFPISLRFGFGLGFWPTFVALLLLALPPIFVNTHTGVTSIDTSVVDAARAMGMREREVLWSVELPAALPLILTGVRISAVQVVATTTLGALVGFACLGLPITQGLRTNDHAKILGGAILVALLSLATEALFSLLARYSMPWSARSRPLRRARTRPVTVPLDGA